MPVFWVAVGVFVVVQGGILYIALRYRHRKGRERMPKQTHGNTRLEIGWTIAPAVVLAVVMVPDGVADLGTRPSGRGRSAQHHGRGLPMVVGLLLSRRGHGHRLGSARSRSPTRWWCPPAATSTSRSRPRGGGAQDANGDPDFQVIHSFWVPQLFGKQDVMPGRTNHIQFQVDEAGTYTGQCAEFCGLQHGRMKLEVVALDPADWEAWVENQKTLAPSPTDPLAKQGEQLFLNPLSDGRGGVHRMSRRGRGGRSGSAEPDATSPTRPTPASRAATGRPRTARPSRRGSRTRALRSSARRCPTTT